jgi:Spy/CpxP family protein refolding chaperone
VSLGVSRKSSFSRFLLMCAAVELIGGCSSPSTEAPPSGTPSTHAEVTPNPSPPKTPAEAKQVVKTRKETLTSPPGLAAHSEKLDRVLSQASTLKLTAEQQARIKKIRQDAAKRLNALAADAKKQRAKADDLASRSNRGQGVSLVEVRKGLKAAAEARKRLDDERDKMWKETKQVLTAHQISTLTQKK